MSAQPKLKPDPCLYTGEIRAAPARHHRGPPGTATATHEDDMTEPAEIAKKPPSVWVRPPVILNLAQTLALEKQLAKQRALDAKEST